MHPSSLKNKHSLLRRYSRGFNILIRVVIIAGAYGTLYLQIFRRHRFDEFLSIFRDGQSAREFVTALPFLLLLMLLNWSAETWKWQILIRKIERLSFLKALRAVLAGITVSMFTPNRVGEYFGRIFVLKEGHRWEGVFITIIGSMSQLIVTLLMGIPAFLLFLNRQSSGFDERVTAVLGISLAGLSILAVLLLGLFMNISFITRWADRLIRDEWVRLRRYLGVFGLYSRRELLPVLVLSLLRYLVFSTQFYIAIRVFGIGLNLWEALSAIPTIFLITTVLPSFTLAELGMRGSATTFVISRYIPGAGFGQVVAAGLIWILNLVLPALAGTFIIARMNFLRRRNDK